MTRIRILADSLPAAMDAVRRELGPGARILHAAERRRGGPWPLGRSKDAAVIAEAPPALRLRVAARLGLARAMCAAQEMARTAASVAAEEARAAVEQSVRAREHGTEATIPALVARLSSRLRAHGLPGDMVDHVVHRVMEEVQGRTEEEEAGAIRQAFVRAVEACIPVAPAEDAHPARPDGRPRVIAVVGPTGVGKTTTVAKLAADCRMRRNVRVGILAADSFRVGAVEQLAAYAQILGAPMRAVDSASALRAAMLDLSWCDVVVLDTAGRSHRDARRIAEIAAVLGAAAPDETHLVLSGAASATAQGEAARAFQVVRPTRVVLSKLDECEEAAALVGALRVARCPASWFTTGQEVPDDIERASAAALAERVIADAEVGA